MKKQVFAYMAGAFLVLAFLLAAQPVKATEPVEIRTCQDTTSPPGTSCTPISSSNPLSTIDTTPVPAGTNYIGQVGVNAVTTGGWTPTSFVAANSNNSTSLKASPGIVHAVQVFGVGASPAWVKFYDKATAPACGSDTVVKQVIIPAASTAANGSGAVATVLDSQFLVGIGYCVVTGIGATDNTAVAASTFVVNIDWK